MSRAGLRAAEQVAGEEGYLQTRLSGGDAEIEVCGAYRNGWCR
jgi:hypothetical protein